MALLYQCNGLERANPQWHTNQSLSITVMTDFPIINPPAVPHMKSSLIVSISEDRKSPETLQTIELYTDWTEGKFNTKENYKLLHQHARLLGTGEINLQPQQKHCRASKSQNQWRGRCGGGIRGSDGGSPVLLQWILKVGCVSKGGWHPSVSLAGLSTSSSRSESRSWLE